MALDGVDGNGLKLEKIGQFFQVLMPRVPKILKKFIAPAGFLAPEGQKPEEAP